MLSRPRKRAQVARVSLGLIRTVNGAAALLAPARFAKRVGVDPDDPGAMLWISRLFGVRTVVIGLDLILPGPAREPAIRIAPVIHASDTAAAAIAGVRGELPGRTATLLTAISGLNTVLAFVAKAR